MDFDMEADAASSLDPFGFGQTSAGTGESIEVTDPLPAPPAVAASIQRFVDRLDRNQRIDDAARGANRVYGECMTDQEELAKASCRVGLGPGGVDAGDYQACMDAYRNGVGAHEVENKESSGHSMSAKGELGFKLPHEIGGANASIEANKGSDHTETTRTSREQVSGYQQACFEKRQDYLREQLPDIAGPAKK